MIQDDSLHNVRYQTTAPAGGCKWDTDKVSLSAWARAMSTIAQSDREGGGGEPVRGYPTPCATSPALHTRGKNVITSDIEEDVKLDFSRPLIDGRLK